MVTEARVLFIFGGGSFGQLGHSVTNARDLPVDVGAALFQGCRTVIAAAGSYHLGVVTLGG